MRSSPIFAGVDPVHLAGRCPTAPATGPSCATPTWSRWPGSPCGSRPQKAVSSSRISTPEQLVMMRHMLLAMDPPVHTAHRQPLSPSFTARTIARMEDQIRRICRQILADAGRRRRGRVRARDRLAAALAGCRRAHGLCPSEDWLQIREWAEQQTSGQDPDFARGRRRFRRRVRRRVRTDQPVDEHGHLRHGPRRPAPAGATRPTT